MQCLDKRSFFFLSTSIFEGVQIAEGLFLLSFCFSVRAQQGQNVSQIDVAVSDGYDLDHDGDMQELDIPRIPRNGTWRPCKRVTYSKVFVQR